MSLQANISDKPFDQKSPRPLEEDVLSCHTQTDRQTDGHRNSDWIGPLGRFSENCLADHTLLDFVLKYCHLGVDPKQLRIPINDQIYSN